MTLQIKRESTAIKFSTKNLSKKFYAVQQRKVQTTEPMCPARESDLSLLEARGKTPSEFKGKALGCTSTCALSPIRINERYARFSD